MRGIGTHMFEEQCGFRYNDCCTDNMPRGFVNFAQYIATSSDSGEHDDYGYTIYL